MYNEIKFRIIAKLSEKSQLTFFYEQVKINFKVLREKEFIKNSYNEKKIERNRKYNKKLKY